MAPKRAFGGVLRPFGGGFRGPNRERASVFSGAGRGRAGGSAVEPGRDQRVQRRGTGRCRWFCGGARRRSQRVQRRRTGAVQGVLRWSRGGASAFSGGARCGTGAEQAGVLRRRRGRGQRVQRRGIGAGRGVQRCRRDGPAAGREGGGMASRPPPRPLPKAAAGCKADGRAAGSQKKCSEGKMRPPPGRKKSVPRGRCAAARTHTGTKKTDLGPFTSISATLLCYSTGFCSGMLVRYTLPHDNGSALREPVSFAGDFRQHVLLQQPVCLRFRSARRLGVTAVKASAIRSLSRSAARRSGLSRLAAGISAVRVAPRESLRPPPGSQFSAVRGHSSQPSGVSAVRSPELAVPAAHPLRRRGHSTTTSVWPSTCNWRISCVELT